ncbi:MAG TPA: hypothetical protein PKB06_11065 [Actinotalea sp.]|nr:hypothetical protein [Actinotalea sp.]
MSAIIRSSGAARGPPVGRPDEVQLAVTVASGGPLHRWRPVHVGTMMWV